MFRISVGMPVHDRVEFENRRGKRLRLTVNDDAAQLVIALSQARKEMKDTSDQSDEETKRRGALAFANAMFGENQALRLLDFYENNYDIVVAACGKYFNQRLAAKIAEAQKKVK